MPRLPVLASLLLLGLPCATFAAKCTGNAKYTFTATYTWAKGNETEAAKYPSIAHFSPTVCAASAKATVFVSGAKATPGFTNIAQTGAEADLVAELKADSESKTAKGSTPGKSAFTTEKLEFELKPDASFLGCVSMIAPSPDWVVGMRDMDLCDTATGKWKGGSQALMVPYTAGTDGGKTYTAEDDPITGKTIAKTTEGVIANYGYYTLTAGKGAGEGKKVKDDKKKKTCFPADATVEIEGGEVKRMDALEVGDRVDVGRGEYSDLFMWTHKLPSVVTDFVELRTAGGASLALSPGHYIYACGDLIAAREVKVGDALTLGNGRADAVVEVARVAKAGLYNPQTVDGRVVVNGVLASTFTTAIEPQVAHALLAPVRAVYQAFGVASAALEGGNPFAGETAGVVM